MSGPGEDVVAVVGRWRTELRRRSEGHRSSDALTELAWADRALAEIERAATGDAAGAVADVGDQDSLFEVTA